MNDLHVIPIGGEEPLHVAAYSCWCHPVQDVESPCLYVHNAKDCRERLERQGVTPGPASAWATVEAISCNE